MIGCPKPHHVGVPSVSGPPAALIACRADRRGGAARACETKDINRLPSVDCDLAFPRLILRCTVTFVKSAESHYVGFVLDVGKM